MAANPFLFNEEPFTSPGSTGSNPFLMNDEEDMHGGVGFNDNPFLSQTAATISTNPFSFDPMELEPAEAEVPRILPGPVLNDPFGDIGGSMDAPFTVTEHISIQPMIGTESSKTDTVSVQKPSDLELKFSHQPANGPSRPPPPRLPPSKETQDLLMSVMGAMDATSSSLLNKIPPTRSPSPVSMRDLHSPSPTPEHNFGDLLDVSDKPSEHVSSTDLFGIDDEKKCDINQNPAVTQELLSQVKPPRPAPPIRPPKPPLPAAIFNQKPKNPIEAPVAAKKDDIEDMDMFGVEATPRKKEVTNADIMNLFNAPKQELPKTDLLCDLMEPEHMEEPQIISTNISEDLTIKEEKLFSPVGQTNELGVDNLMSSGPSQEDLQMDLSDTQSKGSISSVTLNPFAPSEEITDASITQPAMIVDNFREINQNSESEQIDIFEDAGRNVIEEKDSTSNIFGISSSDNFVNQNNDFTTPNETNTFHSQTDSFNDFRVNDNTSVPNTVNAFGDILSSNEEAFSSVPDDFDDFAKKFDSVKTEEKFGASQVESAWGNDFSNTTADGSSGFGQDDGFDSFLALQQPPAVPQSTPLRISRAGSQDSDEDKDFSVFIRPKGSEEVDSGLLPTIAPPPPTVSSAFVDTSPRFNPFDNQAEDEPIAVLNDIPYAGNLERSDSQETPPTPLYDEDVSQPLEPFPRTKYTGDGWEMQLRQPNKKKITGQRFWKKIIVRLQYQPDCVLLQLFNQRDDKDPFQELPLQPCYSVSEIGAQQYDNFGKIFTLKLQYIFYKERPGVRPGQVKKAERITNKLSQFAAYAIQGDYQGVKEFGSDLKKLGLPVEHAPQVSQLMKLGSLNYEDLKQFSFSIEEALFVLQAHRDRALHYKMEEVQITAVDELHVEQDAEGHIEKQIARVRLFFLGFLTGMPDVELGINDMRRQGKEVVGRHDIIPVVTEEWIRLEDVEFHSCIQQEDYNETHIIKFKPPDACYIELMRFRVRPPKNRELPLQLKAQICVTGYKVELRADVLVPGFASRKLGQIPCEDVMIRFPIPECWIYLFRVEKHFRYGSVKSAHRRTGKIKGIERILGTMETLQENLIEVTSGQAKYEHQHRAIVWRCPRLPKEGQGAYTTHNMVCRIALTSYDQMPEKLAEYCYVEFTMPATQVSHTTCRSVSLQNSDSDEPPEKYVRYLARHEYRVGIEHTEGENPNPYAAATYVSKPAAPPKVEPPPKVVEESSSDSD
ncbi:unnamed protein product [Phaedon cochleariae]|uniref:Protein stoned-B n=1 Tax=Phaedon cochleariae TaxID=80249 RepID=A0A9N9SHF3_PHACE|nr:unnamed protein product [Phaedon cochleariae]